MAYSRGFFSVLNRAIRLKMCLVLHLTDGLFFSNIFWIFVSVIYPSPVHILCARWSRSFPMGWDNFIFAGSETNSLIDHVTFTVMGQVLTLPIAFKPAHVWYLIVFLPVTPKRTLVCVTVSRLFASHSSITCFSDLNLLYSFIMLIQTMFETSGFFL